MVLNLDLQKAYDKVEWDFTLDTLSKVGIPPWMANAIHVHMSSTFMAINWNGIPFDSFTPIDWHISSKIQFRMVTRIHSRVAAGEVNQILNPFANASSQKINMSKSKLFKPHIRNIWRKITSWKAKILSTTGRVLQASKLPVLVCKDIEKICKDFIWGSDVNLKKTHVISWESICQPKDKIGRLNSNIYFLSLI
ncbi:hypothetical protein HKD37_05G011985 [Glycine soja]